MALKVGWGNGIGIAAGTVCLDSAYLYWGLRRLPCGLPRLFASVPVLVSYVVLPLIFDRSTNVIGVGLCFFFFTWLATFKVLLLCWDRGPGSEPWVRETYARFAIVLHVPVHIRRKAGVLKHKVLNASWWEKVATYETGPYLALRCIIKLLLLGLSTRVFAFRSVLPLPVIAFAYSMNLYLFVTLVLEGGAVPAAVLCGVELEPHFNNPFAASSLEDFWARRWNLVVSALLKEVVYEPTLVFLTPRGGSLDKSRKPVGLVAKVPEANLAHLRWKMQQGGDGSNSKVSVEATSLGKPVPPTKAARFCATLLTFFVSGVIHEICMYYMSAYVSGEMTAFFTLHGVATGLQVACKPYLKKNVVRIPHWLCILLTLGFTLMTAMWLFFPPFIATDADLRAFSELMAFSKWLRIQ